VLVVAEGRITADLSRQDATPEAVMLAATQHQTSVTTSSVTTSSTAREAVR
jgi:hypothetical protein